jgi:phosphopantothenoylcysteine decarboxylase/phosphopantothenate--cysteine ligase
MRDSGAARGGIHSRTHRQHPYEGKAYRSVAVDSTDEMLRAVLSELTDDSVLVMAAAPADYTAMERSKEKIKKEGRRYSWLSGRPRIS